jgi:hypothetical protein
MKPDHHKEEVLALFTLEHQDDYDNCNCDKCNLPPFDFEDWQEDDPFEYMY